MKQQRGSTIVGFIVGLVVGLGVALVNPFAPIEGFGRPIQSRVITPSVDIGLKLLVNPQTISVSAERFRHFLLQRIKQIKGDGIHGVI